MIRKFVGALAVAAVFTLSITGAAFAASKAEIDARVNAKLEEFYETVSGGRELANKAAGILIFPKVIKAGIGIGGAGGQGALRVGGKTAAYYRTASISIGFQLGAQARTEIILFMTEGALAQFRGSKGWKAGVDGSVALATLGAGGQISTETLEEPVIGFIFSNKGLMYNLSFEGAKISRIKK